MGVQKPEEDVRWPALSLSLEKGSLTQPGLSLKASEAPREPLGSTPYKTEIAVTGRATFQF